MNMHKKLLDLGFKRSEFLKIDNSHRGSNSMVPDNTVQKTERKDGKWVTIEHKKIHPKWNAFYQMRFNDVIQIFILLENNDISRVFMERTGTKGKSASEVFNNNSLYSKTKIVINSKGDIIKLFPKEIQRDFIISSLFD